MKLKDILTGIDCKIIGNADINIKNICESTNEDCNDSLFVAIKGFSTDGHIYIKDAIEKGAIAVAVENDFDEKSIEGDVTIVKIDNTRKALAVMSSNFYKNPSSEMKIIGITGTKGKTTTSYMIKNILENHGYKVRTNRDN